MINVAQIRDTVITALNAYLGRPVVMLEQAAPRPQYPFLGYKFTSPLIPERGLPIASTAAVPSTDPDWEFDVRYSHQSQPTMVLSITVYSGDSDESLQLALQAHAWFNVHGYDELKAAGIVVVTVGAIQNRDTLLVGDYERRQGFDVTLRVLSELTRTVPTIEQVQINS